MVRRRHIAALYPALGAISRHRRHEVATVRTDFVLSLLRHTFALRPDFADSQILWRWLAQFVQIEFQFEGRGPLVLADGVALHLEVSRWRHTRLPAMPALLAGGSGRWNIQVVLAFINVKFEEGASARYHLSVIYS